MLRVHHRLVHLDRSHVLSVHTVTLQVSLPSRNVNYVMREPTALLQVCIISHIIVCYLIGLVVLLLTSHSFALSSSSNVLIMRQYKTVTKVIARSEERRVGKECRSRLSPYH